MVSFAVQKLLSLIRSHLFIFVFISIILGDGLKKILLGFFFFLVALGLCCCTWAFSSCGEWGLLFVAVRGLLIVVASLVVEHGL